MRHCVASCHWGNRYEREIQIFFAKILYSSYGKGILHVFSVQFHESKYFIIEIQQPRVGFDCL